MVSELEETRVSHSSPSADSDAPQRLSTTATQSLRRLSTISKFAVKLNQIHHIRISSTYEDDNGAIVYVVNVYLRYVQKGLPPATESESQRKKRLQLQRETERPMYQVAHRYSAFRELKRRAIKTVNAPGEHRHLMHCAYCSRVKFIDSSATFPPRVPIGRGLVAKATGWQAICTQFRKRQLESFVNQLLRAAKDLSYRTGSDQCPRFLVVSQILNLFLSEPSMRAAVW